MRTAAAVRLIATAALAAVAACSDGSLPSDPSSPQFDRSPQGQARLAALFDQASSEVLALPGTVYADHDEAVGRLVFGVENAAAVTGVRNALARLGISGSEAEIRITPPIRQMATLRDVFRPTVGGIQIHFGNYLCTMGFNVTHSGGNSFITNSHCTNTQGGVERTTYTQPLSSVDGTIIATEVADPAYFKGGACPRGRKCRYSDASRALYAKAELPSMGVIAKPTNMTGSLEVAGSFTITNQDAATTKFPVNSTVVNKVGRTTGWSQGKVTNTCVNTSVSGSQITQLCQTFVSAAVGSGDSGSPVFTISSGDNVTLVGILWGGSSDNKTFVFSPLAQVVQELGGMTATK